MSTTVNLLSGKYFKIVRQKNDFTEDRIIFYFLGKKIASKRIEDLLDIQRKVSSYLCEKYIQPYESGLIDHIQTSPIKKLDSSKIIWQYWEQGIDKAPDIIKLCFDSVEKYKGEYQRIILNYDTIKDYLNIPDFIYKKYESNPNFRTAFFSDLLRIYLLSTYGGIWVDATILLTDKIDDSILSQNFFMYQRSLNKPKDYKIFKRYDPQYFIWDKNFKVTSLSSFIVSKPHHPIIEALKDILTEYWKREDDICYYFLINVLFYELIKMEKYNNLNCDIISDTSPHLMQVHMNKPYSDKLWNSIVSQSNIHKLTLHKPLFIQEHKKETIWGYLYRIS